jgi:hypothetical protein
VEQALQRRSNLLLALFVLTCPWWCEANNRTPTHRIFAPATSERQIPPLNHVDDHNCLCCNGTIQPAVIDATPLMSLSDVLPIPLDLGMFACFGEWIMPRGDRLGVFPPDLGRSVLHCALLESFRC